MKKDDLKIVMECKNIVRTSYSVTAIQNRIFFYLLYNAQKQKNDNYSCTITVDEIKALIPSKNQRTKQSIEDHLKALRNTALLFAETKENGYKLEHDFQLISGKTFDTETNTYTVYFHEKLYNHIIEYSTYAPINLDVMSKFSSFHAQNLYSLLRLWSRTNKTVVKVFTLEELRFIFAVQDKYPEYRNFKQRVLNQALKEINKSGNMLVDIEEIKENRKVAYIKFTVHDKEPKTYFKDNNIIEVATTLADGGKQVPVMQNKFNIEVLEEMQDKKDTPIVPPIEDIPNIIDNSILDNYSKKQFIKHCINNNINFSDAKFITTFNYSQDAFVGNGKGQEVNKTTFAYFKTIFESQWSSPAFNKEHKQDHNNNYSGQTCPKKFNNFEPRQYDYDDLEKRLLGWD